MSHLGLAFVLMLRPFSSELVMSTDLLNPSVLLFCLIKLAIRVNKLSNYTDFKTNFRFELYLKIVNNCNGRSFLTKFRISAQRFKN